MTTRTLLLDSPFLLGFEHTQRLIERAARGTGEAYPPYNVEARDDGALRITLAVAGFSASQLEVLVDDRQLIITGRREGDTSGDGAGESARGTAAGHRCDVDSVFLPVDLCESLESPREKLHLRR